MKQQISWDGHYLRQLVLIFIILVTQFNSISKPIIILLQVLFSIIGVLLGLIVFNMEISVIMTGMGIIAVAGIVVKNAIILFDYTDLLVDKGTPLKEALIEAGKTRLIPVILTAASTVLGLLPLALGMNIDFAGLFTSFDPQIYFGGPNATFWKPLAWSIIFGLTFATFLTLIVVPSMYLMVSRAKTGVAKVANQIAGNGN
jgi:multidrug efflux pump